MRLFGEGGFSVVGNFIWGEMVGGRTSDGRLLVFLKGIVDEAEDEGGLEGRITPLISTSSNNSYFVASKAPVQDIPSLRLLPPARPA